MIKKKKNNFSYKKTVHQKRKTMYGKLIERTHNSNTKWNWGED